MDKTCGTWTTCHIGSCQRHQDCMYRPCRNQGSPNPRINPMTDVPVSQPPINMNAIVLQIEAASERDQMWHRRWKALRALNYHNTNFVDQDGPWTLADFIAYAGEVCGFKPDDDAFARHRQQAERGEVARMEGWRPIETAPKDGTPIILANESQVYCGSWGPSVKGDGWPWVLFEGTEMHQPEGCCEHEDDERIVVNGWISSSPTHWQPLPTPPAGEA